MAVEIACISLLSLSHLYHWISWLCCIWQYLHCCYAWILFSVPPSKWVWRCWILPLCTSVQVEHVWLGWCGFLDCKEFRLSSCLDWLWWADHCQSPFRPSHVSVFKNYLVPSRHLTYVVYKGRSFECNCTTLSSRLFSVCRLALNCYRNNSVSCCPRGVVQEVQILYMMYKNICQVPLFESQSQIWSSGCGVLNIEFPIPWGRSWVPGILSRVPVPYAEYWVSSPESRVLTIKY